MLEVYKYIRFISFRYSRNFSQFVQFHIKVIHNRIKAVMSKYILYSIYILLLIGGIHFFISGFPRIQRKDLKAVMLIRIDRMRIHKIWSMWIRIQDNKITKFISNYLLKVKKKNYFQICT